MLHTSAPHPPLHTQAHLAELDLAQLYLPPKQVVRNLDLLVPGRRLQVFELMAAEQRQRQEQEVSRAFEQCASQCCQLSIAVTQ